MIVETERLRLEPFEDAHYQGLRVMDSDADVMRYVNQGVVKTPDETWDTLRRVQQRWQQYGYSWWVIKKKLSGDIVGAACLQHLGNNDNAPLELGWRLLPNQRGQGFATEAARGIIDFAVKQTGTDYLVAVAHTENIPSQRVMQRLGMSYKGIEEHYDMPCVVYELNL